MTRNHMVHEEVEQPALFGILQTLDLGDKLAVEEEALFAGHWVHSHERVDSVDSFFTDKTACHTGVVDHLCRCVNGVESVQECAEGWGETPGFIVRH